jgi:hypothetical protein
MCTRAHTRTCRSAGDNQQAVLGEILKIQCPSIFTRQCHYKWHVSDFMPASAGELESGLAGRCTGSCTRLPLGVLRGVAAFSSRCVCVCVCVCVCK